MGKGDGMNHDLIIDLIELYRVDLEDPTSNALLAVAKLHKSQDITLPNGDWGTGCISCNTLVYPCTTIQAIEKELE